MPRAKNLPVLMYHHVSPRPGLVTLSPRTFREQMKWLAESGWKTVTSCELEGFYRGESLPRKSVMLTFDDGWLDNWFQVFPVLQEFNLNAHIFLITGLTGKGPVRKQEVSVFSHQECEERIKQGCADDVMLRWSEVQEMRDSGLVEFHLHTHTHQRWDRVDSIQSHLEFLKADILLGRECMKAMLGNCSRHLCWPEGYYTHEYIRVAKALGFSYLYTTERRMNSPRHDPLRIGRISTKEREYSAWLKRRLFYYTTPVFSSLLAMHKGPRVNGD
ncbi:carbohydrate transporter [Salmonella enterica subsp. enterica]|nr:carbohydrate transporter [Salmonella enterica subsp. enterica]EBS5119639.1 carbohydrate transporter [Salmonella enterica subsp. enterica serovar Telelkebir]EDC6228546.1 polysaccharide deacetylase family protein [Salmonella enterica subsp. enterica serovar Eastbourne]EHB2254368.1 polysaccharide deacetylase family protein [Salmonella enterica subsp. enterica serovar Oranienburg]EHM7687739.1 polysaccharide deacetylase family protein [Salmonella enterica subsp. enterica serovar Braenderup]HCM35